MSFRCLLPAPLPPAYVFAYSPSFTYPLLSVIQFVCPVHSCWYSVSFSCLDICSFLTTLSFARFSTCFFPRGSLWVLNLSAVCLGFPLPPSQVPHSSWFSFCLLVFRSYVFLSCGFVFLPLLLRGCLLHVVSGPAFPRYYHLSLLGLSSPSLAVLGWSDRLPFRHFPIVSVVRLPLYVTLVRRFTFLLLRSSDSVESPVPYAMGSSLWAEFIPSSVFPFLRAPFSLLVLRSPSAPLLLLVPLVLFRVSLLLFRQVLLIFRDFLVWYSLSVASFLSVVFFAGCRIRILLLFSASAYFQLCLPRVPLLCSLCLPAFLSLGYLLLSSSVSLATVPFDWFVSSGTSRLLLSWVSVALPPWSLHHLLRLLAFCGSCSSSL